MPELWRETRNIKRTPLLLANVKKFSRPGDLASMICSPLLYYYGTVLCIIRQSSELGAPRCPSRRAECLADHDTNKAFSACDTGTCMRCARSHSPVCTLSLYTSIPVRLPYFILCSEYKARSMCFTVRMVSLRMPVFHDVLFSIWFSRLESENLKFVTTVIIGRACSTQGKTRPAFPVQNVGR